MGGFAAGSPDRSGSFTARFRELFCRLGDRELRVLQARFSPQDVLSKLSAFGEVCALVAVGQL